MELFESMFDYLFNGIETRKKNVGVRVRVLGSRISYNAYLPNASPVTPLLKD